MNDESLVDQLQRLYAINASVTSLPVGPVGSMSYDITSSSINTVTQHAIQGEMLMVSHTYDEFAIAKLGKDAIRQELARLLAEEMLQSSHIEFMQMKDPISGNVTVKARSFVVPNSHVQLLRKAGY